MSCQRVALLQCNDTRTSDCQQDATSTRPWCVPHAFHLEVSCHCPNLVLPKRSLVITDLDLSDTFWRDVLHAVCIPCAGPVDQMAFSSCGDCSDVPGRLKVPISSLSSVRTAGQHLVLCPTSLLDGPIFRLTSFRLRPLMPTLSAPCVAADAEFAGLPFLGQLMKSLGVFCLKRNVDVGKGRIDPDLGESLASFLKSRRPLIVFLEGRRSRGRRHLLRLALGFSCP